MTTMLTSTMIPSRSQIDAIFPGFAVSVLVAATAQFSMNEFNGSNIYAASRLSSYDNVWIL